MTLVRVEGALGGTLQWAPTARRIIAGRPAPIVLPDGFTVSLAPDAVDVAVEPTSNLWLWCVTEASGEAPPRNRYFTIPDQDAINYADLLEVDPTLLVAGAADQDKLATKSEDYTASESDAVIVADGPSLTITLPAAATVQPGRKYTVKNTNATPAAVSTASGTIDGAPGQPLAQWATATYISDGANWLAI